MVNVFKGGLNYGGVFERQMRGELREQGFVKG
jgi:hypothetical protein